jgi:hypothetical protein
MHTSLDITVEVADGKGIDPAGMAHVQYAEEILKGLLRMKFGLT